MIIPLWVLSAIALVAAASGFASGWTTKGWAVDSAALVAQKNAIKERDDAEAKLTAKSEEFEVAREQLRKERDAALATVPAIVQRPSYRIDCFDADGLRVLRAAIRSAKAASAAGQPEATVPSTRRAAQRQRQ